MNILLCIGCNTYDDSASFDTLEGAETDAQQVFDELVRQPGIYDPASSALLLSPTLAEVEAVLRERLFGHPDLDVLTIFFAGHACVAQSSLYLAVKDTLADRLSISAIGMARVLGVIAEAKPRLANVVLDACQAAGSLYDLHSLLKPEVLGGSNGGAVVFLGACSADQYASEELDGGVATTALLRHVRGEVFLQSARPTLDLVEIGLAVSQEVSHASSGQQSPACWAVGLYGYGAFSPNPHHRPAEAHPAYAIDSLAPSSASGQVVARFSEELWEEHRRLRVDWSPTRVHALLHRIVSELAASEVARFVRGISRSLRLRASQADDALAESEVVALCAVLLLPHLDSPECGALARELLDEWASLSRKQAASLAADLRRDRFALLESGLGEFHYLPLKVSKLLGWLGAVSLVEPLLGSGPSPAVREAGEAIFRDYTGSAVAVADEQAAPIYLLTTGLWGQLAPTSVLALLRGYLQSAVRCGGNFLAKGAKPDDVVAYTSIRAGLAVPLTRKSIAHPSELLSVLLQCAEALGESELDFAMSVFDRRCINSFVPEKYEDFGQPTIAKGQNFTQQIGGGVWTLADVQTVVGSKIRTQAVLASGGLTSDGKALCVLAALLLEDRVPYFLELPKRVEPQPSAAPEPVGAPGRA